MWTTTPPVPQEPTLHEYRVWYARDLLRDAVRGGALQQYMGREEALWRSCWNLAVFAYQPAKEPPDGPKQMERQTAAPEKISPSTAKNG